MSTSHAHRLAVAVTRHPKTCCWHSGCTGHGGWQGYCHRHYHKLYPALADRTGIPLGGIKAALRRGRITDPMADRISRAYDQLSGTPGPSPSAARLAAGAGYAPPLAWEGVDIDDPTAVPDHGEATKRTRADLVTEFDHLVRCGVSPERAAKQLGVALGTVDHARYITARQQAGEAA